MERKIHIDLLRIFAISLVVYNHTGLFGYREEIILNGGWDTCIGIVSHIFSEICRMGVPLFFMISGALLLKREETIQQLVKNRIVRFVAFIILFCFIQNFYVSLQQGYPVSFKQFLNSLFFGEFKNGVFVYWFMHVYLAMLLLLPFMRPIVKSLKKEHYIYLIALQTILCALYTTVLYLFVEDAKPPLSNVQAYMPFAFRVYDMPFTGMQWFYFIILGYFAEHIVDYKSITRIQWLCLILLAIGCLLLGASMLMIQQHRMTGSVVNSPFMTTYLTIPMLVLYMGVKTMGMKLRFNKWYAGPRF